MIRCDLIDSLCQRWSSVPSIMEQEDAQTILQMLALLSIKQEYEPDDPNAPRKPKRPKPPKKPSEPTAVDMERSLAGLSTVIPHREESV